MTKRGARAELRSMNGESAGQTGALIKLLSDDDPNTVRLVKEQLFSAGEQSIPELERLAAVDNLVVTQHAQETLVRIAEQQADDDFELVCTFFPDNGSIEEAMWLLARTLYPGTDCANHKRKLAGWGRELKLRLSNAVSDRERVRVLSAYLADRHNFRGNTEAYYSDENSILPLVIDSRLGIPITLTVIYILVAQRAGMFVEGINLPGHFIARHGEVLFDPFHRGRRLSRKDCEEIMRRQGLPLEEQHLEPASNRQIFIRVLANLLYVYDLSGDAPRHDRVERWIRSLAANGS